jgi:outer membrane protein assembly factor BamB
MDAPFAVVPIFVNAGAAVLPAILGALASTLTLLLRPRELLRACRRRPLAASAVLSGVIVAAIACSLLCARSQATGGGESDEGPARPDWAKVALEILRRREAGAQADTSDSFPRASFGNTSTVFRRDYSRSGYDGGPVPLALKLLWEDRPEDTMFLSSPAMAAGKDGPRIFAAGCQFDATGKYGSVVCLEASKGKRVWETNTADAAGQQSLKPFFSSPAITADGKCLVIGQGLHDDADCDLLCLEAATGKIRWRRPTPLHVESSPAICGDMAVAGAGAIEGPDRKPLGDPGFVLAVRISDGAELWRFRVADPESSPAIGEDGTVYIGSGFNGSAVVALRSESDERLRAAGLDRLLWRTPARYAMTGAVTLAGDCLLAGGGNADYAYSSPDPAGVVLALERRTGHIRWEREMDDAVLAPIAVSRQPGPTGKTLAFCPVRSGEVVALDIGDGRVVWRQRISGKAAVLAGCAVAYPVVYAVSRDGYLAVLRARDGKLLEKHFLNQEGKPGQLGLSISSPLLAAGRLFVGSETGGLKCFVGSRWAGAAD